jgi:hypothetical protein
LNTREGTKKGQTKSLVKRMKERKEREKGPKFKKFDFHKKRMAGFEN